MDFLPKTYTFYSGKKKKSLAKIFNLFTRLLGEKGSINFPRVASVGLRPVRAGYSEFDAVDVFSLFHATLFDAVPFRSRCTAAGVHVRCVIFLQIPSGSFGGELQYIKEKPKSHKSRNL